MYDHVKGKARRQSLGLSVKDLAKLLGVSTQAVYQWEWGQRQPSLTTFVAMAHHLQIPLESLMDQAKENHIRQALQLAEIHRKGNRD